MDELIIRVLEGSATPDEAARVAHWQEESGANRERFEAVRSVWRVTTPAPLPGVVDTSLVSRVVAKARERDVPASAVAQAVGQDTPTIRLRIRSLRWVLPLAATVAAVALGIRFWSEASAPIPIAVLEGTVAEGETFTLEDGTFVRLSYASRLEQFDDANERRYSLHGRGFFAVSHDPSRPFVVTAGGVQNRVLGTRFEVMQTESGVRTVVLEGRVAVSDSVGSESVSAGEVAVVSPNQAPAVSRPLDIYSLLDWPGGVLLFQDTPLSEVVKEVAQRFGRSIALGRADLGDLRISAAYDAEPFEDVVASLCAVTGGTCTLSDSLAVIR